MNMRRSDIKIKLSLLLAIISLSATPSWADEPIVGIQNQCDIGGIGMSCTPDGDCDYSVAKVCVDGGCQASCADGCSVGEICDTLGGTPYCKPIPFRMDLNLLDQCIKHWVEGSEPAFSNNQCSYEANLNRLLEQDRQPPFNIFDLDLCILSFLERPTALVDDTLVGCTEETEAVDCGLGSYCLDQTCVRECGMVSTREDFASSLDRECMGSLKTCNYERGRCEHVPVEEVERATCQVERDCISGAYCFLGQCAPYCYRSIDCPSSEWYCTENNQCRVLPDPNTNENEFVFDPSKYAIRFTRKTLNLDAIKTRDASSLAIMDLISRQQVVNQPAISFGYRTMVEYSMKQDKKCLSPFVNEGASDDSCNNTPGASGAESCVARRADCIVDPQTESWIRLTSPFGVINGAGNPSFELELDEVIADRLSPGQYRANITVVYDNGDLDTLTVIYTKSTPSGEYEGSMVTYFEGEDRILTGDSAINLSMKIYVSDETTDWDQINGGTQVIEDVAQGNKVYAQLIGDENILFANPSASGDDPTEHDLPMVGIYYPNQGLMKIKGLITIAGSKIWTENDSNGANDSAQDDIISTTNFFKRTINREFVFFGRFDEKTGRFAGLYTETITGLVPPQDATPTDDSINIKGIFNLSQNTNDETPISTSLATLETTNDWSNTIDTDGNTCTFDTVYDVAAMQTQLNVALVADSDTYDYSDHQLYPNIINFSDLVGEALDSLNSNSTGITAEQLTIYDYLRGRIKTCALDRECLTDSDCTALTTNESEDRLVSCSETGQCIIAPKVKDVVVGLKCASDGQCPPNFACDESSSICVHHSKNNQGQFSCTADSDCVIDSDDSDYFTCEEVMITIPYKLYKSGEESNSVYSDRSNSRDSTSCVAMASQKVYDHNCAKVKEADLIYFDKNYDTFYDALIASSSAGVPLDKCASLRATPAAPATASTSIDDTKYKAAIKTYIKSRVCPLRGRDKSRGGSCTHSRHQLHRCPTKKYSSSRSDSDECYFDESKDHLEAVIKVDKTYSATQKVCRPKIDPSDFNCADFKYSNYNNDEKAWLETNFPGVFTDSQKTKIQSAIRSQSNYLTDTTSEADYRVCINAGATIGDDEFVFAGYSDYFGVDETLCVSKNQAKCGLFKYQDAIINSTDLANFDPSETLPLFCDETLDLAACDFNSSTYTDLDRATPANLNARQLLQEHNRFWLHLVQSMKFEADDLLSDAFLTLYRNQYNPFAVGSAINYKTQRLREAINKYDEILEIITHKRMAMVLNEWPMEHFLQRGEDWMKIMQVIANDRLDAFATLVDLNRRIQLTGQLSKKRTVVQNAMQMEYLFQIYLIHFQTKWEKDSARHTGENPVSIYGGESGEILKKGQEIIRHLSANKNLLGLIDNQVYFEGEHSDPQTSHWEYYRDLLLGDDGLFNEAQEEIDQAADELKSSLGDFDALEEKIFAARREISGYIAEQCGPTADELNATLNTTLESATGLTDQNLDGKIDYCDYLLDKYSSQDTLVKDVISCKLRVHDLCADDADHSCGPDSATYSQACTRLGTTADSFAFKCHRKGATGFVDYSTYLGGTDYPYGLGGPPDVAYADGERACNEVIAKFTGASDMVLSGATRNDPLTARPRCDLNKNVEYTVKMGGMDRICVGGQMGNLIQERRDMEFKREQVIGSVNTMLDMIVGRMGFGQDLYYKCLANAPFDEAIGVCTSPRNTEQIFRDTFTAIKGAIDIAAIAGIGVEEVVNKAGEAVKCEIVAGLAVGTDCPQGIAGAAVRIGGSVPKWLIKALQMAKIVQEYIQDTVKTRIETTHDLQGDVGRELWAHVRDIDDLITEFQSLSQEIFNKSVEIEDLRYQIATNFATYQDDVRFIFDHLIGRESGDIFRGRDLVMKSDRKFRVVLEYTYRMLMAFLHEYNISPANATALKNKLTKSVTLDDIRDFISTIDQYARDYCGLEGIDCDTTQNVEVLRLSLRDLLFSNLRDRVDARSGSVLTAGQQFHNIITSPPYVKQRIANEMESQFIELSFGIPLYLQENGPQGPEWMINPLECNHRLTTSDDASRYHNGNIALNITGQNLGEGQRGLRYEFIRGATDYIRACHAEPVIDQPGDYPRLEYPIRPYTIGYAPQSIEGQRERPKSYVTRSGSLPACLNQAERMADMEADSTCWRFFSRGRSLSSFDWKVRIPIRIDDANTENTWVLGDGLRAEQKPIIEDIIVYFRYLKRPTSDQ